MTNKYLIIGPIIMLIGFIFYLNDCKTGIIITNKDYSTTQDSVQVQVKPKVKTYTVKVITGGGSWSTWKKVTTIDKFTTDTHSENTNLRLRFWNQEGKEIIISNNWIVIED